MPDISYGGQQGYSWLIVHTYSSVAEMEHDWGTGEGAQNKTNRGQYCLISSEQTGTETQDEGKIYQRGFTDQKIYIGKLPRGIGITSITNEFIENVPEWDDADKQNCVQGDLFKKSNGFVLCILDGARKADEKQDQENDPVFQIDKINEPGIVNIFQNIEAHELCPKTIKILYDNSSEAVVDFNVLEFEFTDAIGQMYKKYSNQETMEIVHLDTITSMAYEGDILLALHADRKRRSNIIDPIYHQFVYAWDGGSFKFSLRWENVATHSPMYHVYGTWSQPDFPSVGDIPPGWIIHVKNGQAEQGLYAWNNFNQGWEKISGFNDLFQNPKQFIYVGKDAPVQPMQVGGVWLQITQ